MGTRQWQCKGTKVFAHPYRLLAIAVTLLIATENLLMTGPMPSVPVVVAMAVGYALVVACYWFPVPCSTALVAYTCVAEYAVAGFGLYSSFFLFLGLALFSYEATNTWAGIMCAFLCAYTAAEYVLRPGSFDVYGVIAYGTMFLLLAVLGRGLRWNLERTEQLRTALHAQSELRMLKVNQRMAVQLHDGLSRHLALISMMARQESDNGGPDAGEWAQVDVSSREALRNLRDIIRLLERNHDDEGTEATARFESQLRQELREGDALLRDHGFSGASTLDTRRVPDVIPSRLGSLLLMSVHEAYTNIAKHGDPAVPYAMAVSIGAKDMGVAYRNGVGDAVDRGPMPGGNGLALAAKAIESAGGSVAYGAGDGIWEGRVSLPMPTMPHQAAA